MKPESKTKAGGDGEATATLLDLTLPILQGLLASGHYTRKKTTDNDDKILVRDNRRDWKTDDGTKVSALQWKSAAVEDAISLACELHDRVEFIEEQIARARKRTEGDPADCSPGSLPYDPSPTREDAG